MVVMLMTETEGSELDELTEAIPIPILSLLNQNFDVLSEKIVIVNFSMSKLYFYHQKVWGETMERK